MNSLALVLLALSVGACGELPRPEPVVAAPPPPAVTVPAIVRPLPGGSLAVLPECPGSLTLPRTAPACLVGRDADTGYACFWRCP